MQVEAAVQVLFLRTWSWFDTVLHLLPYSDTSVIYFDLGLNSQLAVVPRSLAQHARDA